MQETCTWDEHLCTYAVKAQHVGTVLHLVYHIFTSSNSLSRGSRCASRSLVPGDKCLTWCRAE